MNKFELIEDNCLGNNKDFDAEKVLLLEQGFILVHQYTHPAIGRVAVFSQAEPDPATLADNAIEFAMQG